MALLPNYKDIVDLLKKGSTLEAQEKIMELREGALALQEENLSLREKIKELEERLNKKKNIVWQAPLYWMQDGDNKEGPFCQKCYDADEKLIRLQDVEKGNWHCKVCDSVYFDDSYKPSNISVGTVKSRRMWDGY
jgi:ribosomal protein L37AE/L43A